MEPPIGSRDAQIGAICAFDRASRTASHRISQHVRALERFIDAATASVLTNATRRALHRDAMLLEPRGHGCRQAANF
jgi:hypothetical protein